MGWGRGRGDEAQRPERDFAGLRLQNRVGRVETVLIDEVVEEGAVARSKSDAPEIDGQVFIDGATHLQVGAFAEVEIEEADEYDLWGRLV